MFLLEPTLGPGLGIRIRQQAVPVTVREVAVIVGQPMQFDLGLTDGATTDNALDGGVQSGFANVIDPDLSEQDSQGAWHCLATATAAVGDEQDMIVTSQRVSCLLEDGGAIALYDMLTLDKTESDPAALTADVPAAGAGAKIMGVALATITPATPTAGTVAFSGIVPLGHIHSD